MNRTDLNHKTYLMVSDFDQTLSLNDSGVILSELIGVSDFEQRVAGLESQNLIQQGAELSYLLLHDPEFRKVRREDLCEAGQRIRLKPNVDLLVDFFSQRTGNMAFEFYVVSAAPVEVIQSALEGIVPAERIFGTRFRYSSSGEIESIIHSPSGYGKVTVLSQLQKSLQVPYDRVIYMGDGSSDVIVMLYVKYREGYTIAVSENPYISRIARRTVLSENAFSAAIPILEDILKWESVRIRDFLEARGLTIQDWQKSRTDFLSLRGDLVEMGEVSSA